MAYHGPVRVLHEIKTLLKYRAMNNYTDGEYIGQRLGDKVLFSLILMSLYWQTGNWSEGDGPAPVYNLNALLLAMVRTRRATLFSQPPLSSPSTQPPRVAPSPALTLGTSARTGPGDSAVVRCRRVRAHAGVRAAVVLPRVR